jgi:hypothetical protein
MKKEYLILIVLILSLGAYLVLKKDNRQNYTLPEPVKIEKGKIDKIIITKGTQPLELTKDKESWVVTDKKYSADMAAVNRMLDLLRNLRISGLISESKDLLRYELDEKRAIGVKAFMGKDLLISFKIGKTAPSANHTFVMIGEDPRVFQADNNFKADFDIAVDMLRDKTVLTVKEASIKQITIKKDGVTKVLTRNTPDPAITAAVSDAAAPDATIPENKKKENPAAWKFKEGNFPDKEALTNLLSSLSFLTCEGFPKDLSKETIEKELPFLKITLEDEAPIILNLFTQKEGDSLIGTSSMNPYPFVLESYKTEDIISYVDKIAGIVKETKK